jgi:hypothetical protein
MTPSIVYLTDSHRITAANVLPYYPPSRSVDGYGSKLPTPYSVQIDGEKWRQVYAICWSNVASFYVILDKQRQYFRDCELEAIRDNTYTFGVKEKHA